MTHIILKAAFIHLSSGIAAITKENEYSFGDPCCSTLIHTVSRFSGIDNEPFLSDHIKIMSTSGIILTSMFKM